MESVSPYSGKGVIKFKYCEMRWQSGIIRWALNAIASVCIGDRQREMDVNRETEQGDQKMLAPQTGVWPPMQQSQRLKRPGQILL